MKQPSISYARPRGPLWLLLTVALTGCGTDNPFLPPEPEPENVAPMLAAIPDQEAVLKTLENPSVTVALEITDPDDDTLTVTVASDDDAVLPPLEQSCGPGDCLVTLTPNTDAPVSLSMTVSVDDGSGGQTSGVFTLRVAARLVTSAEELGPGTLAGTIGASEPGDVIGFDTDGVFATPQTIELLAEIAIGHDLVLEGPGADRVTVSGSGVSRVFRVDGGANVTMSGLRLADGVAPSEQIDVQGQTTSTRLGGDVLVTGGSRLTLRDVVVTGGATPQDVDLAAGGGVANLDATLVIVGGEISGNASGFGGGVATVGAGVSPATTVVETVSIHTNTAVMGGGLAGRQANVILRGAEVSGNVATDGGGAYSEGALAVEASSVIDGNQVTQRGGGIFIAAGELSLTNSTLSANSARAGGGLGVAEVGVAELTEAAITGNVAALGGGVFSDGMLDIRENSVVSSNEATGAAEPEGGGGLYNTGTLTADGIEIRDNTSASEAGGLFNAGTATLSDLEVSGNMAARFGGGMNNTSQIVLVRVTVSLNEAEYGGALANRGSSDRTAEADITDSEFGGNGAAYGGGVIGERFGRILLDNTALRDNEATVLGGAIHNGDDLVVRGGTIAGNSAAFGGGINHQVGNATVDGTDVLDNEASSDGGGIRIDAGALTLRGNGRTAGNIAGAEGGGLYVASGELLLERTYVEGNRALRGGGLFVGALGFSPATVNVRDSSRIAENVATQTGGTGGGGGIYGHSPGGGRLLIAIADSRVERNTAELGGGIRLSEGTLTLFRSRVGNNEVTNNGGGILAEASSVLLEESSVIANVADGYGGGLRVIGTTVEATGSGCLILGNRADAFGNGINAGGGVFHQASDLSLLPSSKVCLNDPEDIYP